MENSVFLKFYLKICFRFFVISWTFYWTVGYYFRTKYPMYREKYPVRIKIFFVSQIFCIVLTTLSVVSSSIFFLSIPFYLLIFLTLRYCIITLSRVWSCYQSLPNLNIRVSTRVPSRFFKLSLSVTKRISYTKPLLYSFVLFFIFARNHPLLDPTTP